MMVRSIVMAAAMLAASPAPGQPGPMDMRNRGTAPDWLNTCMFAAVRQLHVAYNEVHLDSQRASRTQRVVEGQAGARRFRCVVDGQDRLRSFTVRGRGRN